MSEEQEEYKLIETVEYANISTEDNKNVGEMLYLKDKPEERFSDYLNKEITRVKESLMLFPMMLKNEKEIRLHALEQIKDKFKEIFEDK